MDSTPSESVAESAVKSVADCGVRRTFKKVGGGPVRLSVQGGLASESGGIKSKWSQADLWN